MKILEISPPPNSIITFYNANKDPVGTLDLNEMTFTGDADEAAQVFFKSVLELYDNELTKARQTIQEISELHKWLLGEGTDFPLWKEGQGRWYWRTEFRKKLEAITGSKP